MRCYCFEKELGCSPESLEKLRRDAEREWIDEGLGLGETRQLCRDGKKYWCFLSEKSRFRVILGSDCTSNACDMEM